MLAHCEWHNLKRGPAWAEGKCKPRHVPNLAWRAVSAEASKGLGGSGRKASQPPRPRFCSAMPTCRGAGEAACVGTRVSVAKHAWQGPARSTWHPIVATWGYELGMFSTPATHSGKAGSVPPLRQLLARPATAAALAAACAACRKAMRSKGHASHNREWI